MNPGVGLLLRVVCGEDLLLDRLGLCKKSVDCLRLWLGLPSGLWLSLSRSATFPEDPERIESASEMTESLSSLGVCGRSVRSSRSPSVTPSSSPWVIGRFL